LICTLGFWTEMYSEHFKMFLSIYPCQWYSH